jgi:hypothetical protein
MRVSRQLRQKLASNYGSQCAIQILSLFDMNFKRGCAIFILLFTLCAARAQAQAVGVSNFSLYGHGKNVIVTWTLDSGATCNGIVILRGPDTLNFVQAGEISGVCGNSNSVTSYTFTDCCPEVNRVNYYKLKLGLSQYSSLRSIYLDYVEPGTVLVKMGSPAAGITFRFSNDQQEACTFRVFNESGKEVYRLDNLREDEIVIEQSSFVNGPYFYRLETPVKTYKGKLMIAR